MDKKVYLDYLDNRAEIMKERIEVEREIEMSIKRLKLIRMRIDGIDDNVKLFNYYKYGVEDVSNILKDVMLIRYKESED